MIPAPNSPQAPADILQLGCGIWGRKILRDLLLLGCRVHVVDPDGKAREAAAALGALGVGRDLPTGFRCDGIVIATPASRHFSSIESVSHYHVPVFVEKPMVTRRDEASRICEPGRPEVFVMQTWQYHAGIECLAALVRSGELGALRMVRSTRCNWTSPRTDVDPVWTLLPHDISIVTEMFGAPARPVFARAECLRGMPVGMLAILEHDDAVAVLEVTTRSMEKIRRVELRFEGGVAVLPNDHDGRIEVLRDDGAAGIPGALEWPVTPGALYRQLEAFVNYLGGGTAPRCTAAMGASIVNQVLDLRAMAGITDP
jgi:predicted dehydrogenase